MDKTSIRVTSPLMPDLDEFRKALEEIWESRWLTNFGTFHERLETALAEYLGVPYISLFANGTLPLLTALQALGVRGEVITTPYTFVATTHSLWWNGLTPVFVDVDPLTGNIDPSLVEAAVTDATCAILPVHVYGTPCDTDALADIASRHGLKLIYDAAHAFAVRRDGRSILLDGDMSTLSFHATKVFNTLEGGAVVVKDAATKKRMDYLKNFGFEDEVTVTGPGINSKMDEMRAAFGLLNLKHIDDALARRSLVAETYRKAFSGIPGLRFLTPAAGVESNNSYFPVFVDEKAFGMTRDALYDRLRGRGILCRRYFYPLVSEFSPYSSLPSAAPANLPVATSLSRQVLCLPIHQDLPDDDVASVISAVLER